MPKRVMVLLLSTCYSPCSDSLTVEKSESLGGLMQEISRKMLFTGDGENSSALLNSQHLEEV